jgi:hypothetical protein
MAPPAAAQKHKSYASAPSMLPLIAAHSSMPATSRPPWPFVYCRASARLLFDTASIDPIPPHQPGP